MDFETAFRKPFTDAQKLLIGVLLSILPIVNWLSLGFGMECSGVGKNKKSNKMPEWKDWGDYFMKGLMATIICIIYMLPAIVIFIIGAGSIIGSFFGMFMQNMNPFGAHMGGFAYPEMFESLLRAAPFMALAGVACLAAAYIVPMAIIFYLKKNSLSEALKFGDIFKKAFTQNYFIAWIVTVLVGMLGGFILARIPLIGGAFVSFCMQVTGFTLFGEAASK